MSDYLAFLRGMNLGKRRLEMATLRTLFTGLGFAEVATYIASGNVLFSTRSGDTRKLEQRIETCLRESLGYEVDTFVRTRAEVAACAAFPAFAPADLANPQCTVHVGFFKEALDPGCGRRLLASASGPDELNVAGREYYWLCRIKSHESKLWSSSGLKALRLPVSSMRNLNTVRKLAALYPVR